MVGSRSCPCLSFLGACFSMLNYLNYFESSGSYATRSELSLSAIFSSCFLPAGNPFFFPLRRRKWWRAKKRSKKYADFCLLVCERRTHHFFFAEFYLRYTNHSGEAFKPPPSSQKEKSFIENRRPFGEIGESSACLKFNMPPSIFFFLLRLLCKQTPQFLLR